MTPISPVITTPRTLSITQAPLYSSMGSGVPVNIRHGAMLTESRGIFISSLSFSVGPSELEALLKVAGRPIRSELLRDASTGRFKGSATAQFATKEEAQQAANRLNNSEHMGMVLKVRLDKETTSIGQVQGPVIANGSTGY
jgi:RNA recognition motif-containing protein